jgi:hypothetical protein
MTIFAGCVTMLKIAMVVNAVSVSKWPPRATDIRDEITSVMAGENIPRALAIFTLDYT